MYGLTLRDIKICSMTWICDPFICKASIRISALSTLFPSFPGRVSSVWLVFLLGEVFRDVMLRPIIPKMALPIWVGEKWFEFYEFKFTQQEIQSGFDYSYLISESFMWFHPKVCSNISNHPNVATFLVLYDRYKWWCLKGPLQMAERK